MNRLTMLLVIAGLPASWCSSVRAEPWFAVLSGAKCVQCHANPTGGGLRNEYGNAWAQLQLAAERLAPADAPLWTGQAGSILAVGGNARAEAALVRVPDQDTTSELLVSEARVYGQAELIPRRLAIGIDQRIAPGSTTTLEANVRLWLSEARVYLKAGRSYLPFGWRLEDDAALVRQLSGVNMQAPQEGLELGIERDAWSAQLAVSNGNGGAPENDDGKQVTARVVHVRSAWRLGASIAHDSADAGDRTAAGVFAGWRLGPTSWLAELDYVDDAGLAPGGREALAALIEANWLLRRGHNLKVTHEWLDPDEAVDEDEQTRSSLIYEWSATEFLQLRLGVRQYDGIEQSDIQNRTQAFVQLHAYF